MSLFKKKTNTPTLDDILSAIDTLSDGEKEAVIAKLGISREAPEEAADDSPEEPAEETAEEAEEPAEDPAEETNEQEAAAEAIEEPAEEAAEEAEEPAVEGAVEPVEEPAEEPTASEAAGESEDVKVLRSMVEELKKTVEGLAARINAEDENNKNLFAEFGIAPGSAGKEAEEVSEVEKMKAKYWNL